MTQSPMTCRTKTHSSPPPDPLSATGLPSPATPLLQSWNYLDDIPEDASKTQEFVFRNHHHRYHSYDSPIYTAPADDAGQKELIQDARLSVPYIFELFGPFSASSYGEYLGIDVTHDRREMSVEIETLNQATKSAGKKTQRRHSIASLSASISHFPRRSERAPEHRVTSQIRKILLLYNVSIQVCQIP